MYVTAAPASLFVLLVATLSLSISSGNRMAAEGLPVRRERGAAGYEDILAGNDFLSVFLEASLLRARKETTTEEPVDFLQESTITESVVRTSRQVDYIYDLSQGTDRQSSNLNTSDNSSSDGVIIAVHVSSSVGSQINKDNHDSENRLGESSKHIMVDQNNFVSEEHPSIVAESSKSELSVEEPVPITTNDENRNNDAIAESNSGTSSLQSIPASQHISFNLSGFINTQNKASTSPFHHSLIYHDYPKDPGRARSVSYSSIIQEISPAVEKPSGTHERKERNYETGSGYINSLGLSKETHKEDKGKPRFKTSTTFSSTASWVTPSHNKQESSTLKYEINEKNWSTPYSPVSITQQLTKIYGRSEQSYEVDEAVSVETNGRTHGIQEIPVAPTAKTKSDQEKDQKVGYVVEGRNYRKYRVEERTPDGFIVGEYGVVSHNDGSLRGVRYTADGTINPRLIYDALMKFLAL